jgi:hypothetical protein
MIQEVEDRFFAISKDHRSNDSGYVELDALSFTAHRPAAAQRLARYPSNCVLLASLDGLLLLRSSKSVLHCQHLVCNPLTRQWSDLPPLIPDAGVDARQRESGFYFHEPSGEYRLLCHVTFCQPRPESWAYYVFSAGADEPRRLNAEATPMWNTVVTTLRSHPSLMKPAFYDNLMAPAVLHGHLHWMQHIEAGFTGQIVAFDTVTEMFRRMAPPPMTHNDPEHSHLLVANGSLMASELDQLFVDLWVLQGYDGSAAPGTWERHVRIEVPCHTDNRLLIATGGDGGDVILGTPGGVVVYNVRSGTVKQVMDIDASRSDTVVSPSRVVFRESIVRHRFFEARPHPGLRYFSFCS